LPDILAGLMEAPGVESNPPLKKSGYSVFYF